MKRLYKKPTRRGFTLIELLTAIAIMGLLAGAMLNIIPRVRVAAAKANASRNLSSINTTYLSYATGGGRLRNISKEGAPNEGGATSVAQYAEVLAREGMNDAAVWYIENDQRLDGVTIPQQVLKDGNGANQMESAKPASWAVVVNAGKNLDTNYPLIWTRGLETAGTWKENSPWGDTGGHIAFGDGHILWYNRTTIKGEQFISRKDKKETPSYQEAIGENAVRLEDE
ncbi:MAG: type II secretion system GspH family protein [Puniceicoccales bacterium]|jgi:prepilin-type N-terminal cleavage/methylation domain-containing protein|nr:type II secretion system GspH family protein [Puniceicoccales bacterium]